MKVEFIDKTITKFEQLEFEFEQATKEDSNYLAVATLNPETEDVEITVNSRNSYESKLSEYRKSYNDDLTHKTIEGRRIVGATHSNTFEGLLIGLPRMTTCCSECSSPVAPYESNISLE